MTLVERLQSYATAMTSRLADTQWRPHRTQYESARNRITEAADAITRLTTLNEGYKGHVDALERELTETKREREDYKRVAEHLKGLQSEPFAWVLSGDDTDKDGWIDARIDNWGEFTKPLYALPPSIALRDAKLSALQSKLTALRARTLAVIEPLVAKLNPSQESPSGRYTLVLVSDLRAARALEDELKGG